jgi:hypothetical protein
MAQKAKAIFDKDKETVFKTVNEITRENNGDKE